MRVSRPALAASRAIDILNYMAAAPLRSLSLSDLVRALGLNPASCHALVTALTRDGYLVRQEPGKTYRLGPALIAIGHGALQCHPLVAAAREQMADLSREVDLDCLLTTRVGDRLIALATEGAGRTAGLGVGQRVPLIPPLGTPFLAWADEAEVGQWLDRAAEGIERDRLRASLAAVRARGYAVTLRSQRQGAADAAVQGLAEMPFADDLQERLARAIAGMGDAYLMIDAAADRLYPVDLVSAPVFAADGSVACTLSLHGFGRPLSLSRLDALGRALHRHCRAAECRVSPAAPTTPLPEQPEDAECAR